MSSGLIPQGFVDDLLARTDIVEVISPRVELKRAGKELKGLSPFTGEKTPSFYVNPAKQMYFDFSSGKNGNAIGFLMDFENLGFVEAVEELARMAGVDVPREAGKGPSQAVLQGPLDALAAAERHFRTQLKQQPLAQEYLKGRGVDGETAKQFAIGYAPDAWDSLAKQFSDPRHALTAGLLIEKDGGNGRVYDRFRNRLMFPIRDGRGRTIGFGGRTLGDDPAKYLNSPETPVFHKGTHLFGIYEARQANQEFPFLLVVEGYMDVVALFQHGLPLAVATLGTATTADHLKLLFRNTRRVVFSFDGDDAGRRAARKALEVCIPHLRGDREVRFLFLPDGHDPDTLVQEIGADAFRDKVEAAMPLSDYLLQTLQTDLDMNTLEGRARLAEKAKPWLADLPPGPLRELIADELQRRTGVSGETTAPPPPAPRPRDQGDNGEQPRPVRRALQLLLEHPRLADRVEHMGQLAQVQRPGMSLLLEVVDYFQEHPDAHAGHLIQRYEGQQEGGWLQQLAVGGLALDEEAMAAEFDDIILRLRAPALLARIRELQARADQLGNAERAELIQLMQERAAMNIER